VESDVTVDPFEGNISKNNQVILTPKSFGTDEDSAFFLVFGQAPKYQAEFSLKGVAFDLPSAGGDEYFVPSSCAQCHGHDSRGKFGPAPVDLIYRRAMVNHLDTDLWHDAMSFDFPQLSPIKNPVVFDGGEDQTSAEFDRAFDVIRELNLEAHEQNVNSSQKLKAISAKKWLDLHQASNAPVPQTMRALDTGTGGIWSALNAEDQELLSLLSRNCSRCHGSIRYNVFDKGLVKRFASKIVFRIFQTPGTGFHMPQGRVLNQTDIDRMEELLGDL